MLKIKQVSYQKEWGAITPIFGLIALAISRHESIYRDIVGNSRVWVPNVNIVKMGANLLIYVYCL